MWLTHQREGKIVLSVRETAIHGKRRERKRNWVCFYEREGERAKDCVCARKRVRERMREKERERETECFNVREG